MSVATKRTKTEMWIFTHFPNKLFADLHTLLTSLFMCCTVTNYYNYISLNIHHVEKCFKPKLHGSVRSIFYAIYFSTMNIYNARSTSYNWTSIRGCIQKYPVWPPGARTPNGTALCH